MTHVSDVNGPVLASLRHDDLSAHVLVQAHERATELGVPLVVHQMFTRSEGGPPEGLALRVRELTGRHRSEFTVVHREGNPVRATIDLIHELRPSLAVFAPSFTATFVLRHVEIPVLIARGSTGACVLAATDFSDPDLPALHAGVREAHTKGLPLKFFHAVDAQSRLRQRELGVNELVEDVKVQLRAYGREHRVPVDAVAVAGDPAVELTRAASTADVALLVVARRPRPPGSRYFQPSVADIATSAANCSVLSVPKRA